MAVAGSAVGLGNFLRFPGLAARYGSGAFMIAYFAALLLIGIPICWAEWTVGRVGGSRGFHSSSGIFHALVRHPLGKYLGLLGFLVPVFIYMYYIVIEGWCLGYALNFLAGNLDLGHSAAAYRNYFSSFTGAGADGVALAFSLGRADLFLLVVFGLNLLIIYHGITRGIETVCLWGMPALLLIAVALLVRVLTLGTPDPALPEQSLWNGLGYMWNPRDIAAGLARPELWLAAAGQVFFTLSVGFGVIITYASYLTKKDDIVLSSLTACSTNEFCEVVLGGMITVPAAFTFLGAAGIVGMGTFDLGFMVLPQVFATMHGGQVFGFLFFLLLFIAAITSSLSMLQPGIAYLEEGLGLERRQSVLFLGMITAIGSFLVLYFSKDLKALDTIDFWVGTVGVFIQGTVLVIVFSWVLGVERGWEEAHHGAEIRIPGVFKPILKYITPTFLIAIFALFLAGDVFGWNFSLTSPRFAPTARITDLIGTADRPANPVAIMCMVFIAIVTVFAAMLVGQSGHRWARHTPPGPAAGESRHPSP